MMTKLRLVIKVCLFWSCAFLALCSPEQSCARESTYHAIVIFEQLILFVKGSFPADAFQEITGIADALKKNAHDQNEQIMQCVFLS